MTEAELQRTVIETAEWKGWTVHGERPARTTNGWVTPIQGTAGFPDLTLIKGRRLLVAELKSDKGRLTELQKWWLELFANTGAETFVWRPRDWDEIVATLEGNDAL